MVCGLVLLYQANQVRSKRFMHWGTTCITLGVAMLILATSITTQRETVIARTKDLVAHTAPLETDTLRPYLTDDCAFYRGPSDSTATVTLKEVDNFIRGKTIDIVDSQTIRRLDASVDSPTTARSQLWLRTYVKAPLLGGESLPVSTRWELQWVLKDDLWKVHSVRMLEKE